MNNPVKPGMIERAFKNDDLDTAKDEDWNGMIAYHINAEIRTEQSSASPGCSTPLRKAAAALEEYEQLPTLVEKLQYCQHPKWHTLLQDLVKELTDTTVRLRQV